MYRASLVAGCLFRQGFPLPVNRAVGDWEGSLRCCVCCLAVLLPCPTLTWNEAPVAQLKPQPLVPGHTVLPGVLLQFQGTGYPEQAAFLDVGFLEPAHHITPGPDLVILDPGPLPVPDVFPQGKTWCRGSDSRSFHASAQTLPSQWCRVVPSLSFPPEG